MNSDFIRKCENYVMGDEMRPAVIAENVKGLSISGLTAKVDAHLPVLVLRGVIELAIAPKGSITRSRIKKEVIRLIISDTPTVSH